MRGCPRRSRPAGAHGFGALPTVGRPHGALAGATRTRGVVEDGVVAGLLRLVRSSTRRLGARGIQLGHRERPLRLRRCRPRRGAGRDARRRGPSCSTSHGPDRSSGRSARRAAAATGLRAGRPSWSAAPITSSRPTAPDWSTRVTVSSNSGGSGDILAVSDEKFLDARLYLDRYPIPGKWLPNGCMATSGSMLRWEQGLFDGRRWRTG